MHRKSLISIKTTSKIINCHQKSSKNHQKSLIFIEKYQKSLIFIKKIIGNHIWRENFNLNTRVSNFSNQFSSKNHQKSSIFIEKTWKIMDFDEKLWKIIFDVKISIYMPACRFFVNHFHRKIIKNHEFSSKNDGESTMEIAPWILES